VGQITTVWSHGEEPLALFASLFNEIQLLGFRAALFLTAPSTLTDD